MTADFSENQNIPSADLSPPDVGEKVEIPNATRKDYMDALERFDIAVCDALAVGQAAAGRMAPPHHGYGTHIFVCICNMAVAMIRAVPLSRWMRSDFQHWAFSGIAAYARAIVEGQVLFSYVMETPESPEAWSAKLNVMYLNDCTRRISLHANLEVVEQVKLLEGEAEKLRDRLRKNEYFLALPAQTQKRCLAGENPMIPLRYEMVEKLEWNRNHFRAIYDLLSQHAHILTLSFLRLEPNGRGTGLENVVDRSYIYMMLDACAEVLKKCTDQIVEAFPDVAVVRLGKKSRFSPGPRGNLPR